MARAIIAARLRSALTSRRAATRWSLVLPSFLPFFTALRAFFVAIFLSLAPRVWFTQGLFADGVCTLTAKRARRE